MASAVQRREALIEAARAPTHVLAATTHAAAAPAHWYMIVGPDLDLQMPASLPSDPVSMSDVQYLDAARSSLGLREIENATEADADAEFTAILRMKTEPLTLTEAEAEVYNRLRQRRARRVGQPLPIE